MKQEIWFDVDDTLVDTATEIHRVMLEKTGLDVPINQWNDLMFSSTYNIGPDQVNEMRQWWQDGQILERAQLREGALKLLRWAYEQNYHIGLISARAWHPRAREITESFIHQHQLPVEELKILKFHESKQDLLAPHASRTVGFVDDSPRHVQAGLNLGISSLLVCQPWNRQHRQMKNVKHLNEIALHLNPRPSPKPKIHI